MTALHALYPRDLLTTTQAAERVGVKPGTIRQWQARGHLTPAIPAGDGARANLYARQDIDRVAADMAARRAAA